MKKNKRHQHCEFRLRSYFCEKCELHIQFFGNDPVVGKCPCGKPISELPLESDHLIEAKKVVTNLMALPLPD